MGQVIACMETSGAAALFEGAVAGEVELELSGIGSEKRVEKLRGVTGVIAHDGLQAINATGIGFVEARDAVFGGAVGDVFVERGAGLGLVEKKIAIGLRNIEGRLGEKQNVACFELSAKPAALCCRII